MNDNTLRRFTQLLRFEFYEAVERKTGWGKEELKREFEMSMGMALATMLDQDEKAKEPKEVM